MSKLCIALDEYLKMRRALGHKLRLAGGLLPRFVEFANCMGADFITTDLALRWAHPPSAGVVTNLVEGAATARLFISWPGPHQPPDTTPARSCLP